jgi:hypothetical protein
MAITNPTINVGGIERPMTDEEVAAYTQTTGGLSGQASAWNDANRHAAYVAESDPLFFQWQRGETTEQAWRDKVAEIQARYPDPA